MDSSGRYVRRLLFSGLLVLLALLFVCTPAYAVTYGDVIYGPSSDNGGSYYVQVYAFDRYTAALGALGFSPNDSRLTDDAKAYLSNSSTGGAFYTFAQLFSDQPFDDGGVTVGPGGVGMDYGITSMYTAYRMNVDLYGSQGIWWARYTPAQRVAAVTSVGLILAGDIPSAGGGSIDDGDYYVFNAKWLCDIYGVWSTAVSFNMTFGGVWWSNLHKPNSSQSGSSRDNAKMMPSTFTVKVPKSYFPVQLESGKAMIIFGGGSTGGKLGMNLIYTTGEPFTFGTGSNEYGTFYTVSYSGSALRWNYNNTDCMFDGSVLTMPSGTAKSFNSISNFDVYADSNGNPNKFVAVLGNGDSGTPTPPPTDWPDEPTPDPPTQPVVPDPPLDPNPPQNPTVDPYPTDTIVINNTYTIDIQGILDAMADHCQHIRDSIYQNTKRLYEGIAGYLEDMVSWWGTLFESTMLDVCDYMQELFEWLADQFDFSVSGGGYDDNTVVSWLKRIYYKLGSGTNTRPTDPVAEPWDIGQWLMTLFGNLFTALDDLAGGLLSDLATWISALATKFPFSIPWDVAAILGLLVANPVAPNFDLPWYTISLQGGLTQAATIEVDLADLSPYFEGIRFMIKLCFVVFLAMHTKDFMELMEKAVGLDA